MSSPIYQYVIDLVVSLPIGRVGGVFMNVPVWEQPNFSCGNVYCSNTIIISILMQTIIPNCRFENILSPHFCIKIS